MLPGILSQLGSDSLSSLKKLASTVANGEYCPLLEWSVFEMVCLVVIS